MIRIATLGLCILLLVPLLALRLDTEVLLINAQESLFGDPDVTAEVRVHGSTETTYRPSPGRGQVPPGLVGNYGSELRPGDWSYYLHEVEFDIVPHGDGAEIFAAEFIIEYNLDLLEFDHVRNGDLFTVSENGSASALQYQELDPSGSTGRVLVNIANLDGNGNVDVTDNDLPLATISFYFISSGVSAIHIVQESFHTLHPNGDFPLLSSETQSGDVEFFRGDFVGGSEGGGNGSVIFADFIAFQGAVSTSAADSDYRIKFDISSNITPGPSDDPYFLLPVSQGIIAFSDFVVFGEGFTRTSLSTLPEPLSLLPHQSLVIAAGSPTEIEKGVYAYPIYANNVIPKDGTFSFEVSIPEMEFLYANPTPGQVNLIDLTVSLSDGGNVLIEGEVTTDPETIQHSRTLTYLVFEGTAPGTFNLRKVEKSGALTDHILILGNENRVFESERNNTSALLIKNIESGESKTSKGARFYLPKRDRINLSVYNLSGSLELALIDGLRSAGEHEEVFDLSSLESGVYLYKIRSGNRTHSAFMRR